MLYKHTFIISVVDGEKRQCVDDAVCCQDVLKKVQQLVGEQHRPVRFGSYDAREVRLSSPLFVHRQCDTSLINSHSHPFNGPLSGTTWVSRYQKGKTSLDFTGARQ